MELWIRTQNKGGLIKVESLGNTDGTIHAYSGNNKIVLGEYASNERAVEVLDEIQKIIGWIQSDMKCVTAGELYELAYQNYVYNMPKE